MISSATDCPAAPERELILARDQAEASQQPVAPPSRPPRGKRRPGYALSSESSTESDLERRLFLRYQREGDLHAREQLVERYLPLARSLARRYGRGDESSEDLLQVASLGLVKAIDRFDPERGIRFSSFGVPTILGELKRHFRDSAWALRLPRDMQERVLKVNAAKEHLAGALGRSPSPTQLAQELNLPVEEVLEAIVAHGAYVAAPLEAPLPSSGEEVRTLADTLGEEDSRFELVEGRVSIDPVLEALPERERLVLHLRFAEDLTQTEIAQRIGVSQMQVSRLIRQALDRAHVLACQAA